MPFVPNVPGVPSLSSYLTTPSPVLAIDTALTLSQGLQPLQWGIYSQTGIPIIASSLAPLFGLGQIASVINSVSSLLIGQQLINLFSVVDFEYKQDWSISTAPQEKGAFQSYDKVQLPFDVRMRIAAGGAESNRSSLLSSVEGIADVTDLFNVVTPEETYLNCNVSHYDYKRTSINGVGILVVDIWLVEIRVTATASFSNTQQPTAAGQQALGNVQPGPSTPAVTPQ